MIIIIKSIMVVVVAVACTTLPVVTRTESSDSSGAVDRTGSDEVAVARTDPSSAVDRTFAVDCTWSASAVAHAESDFAVVRTLRVQGRLRSDVCESAGDDDRSLALVWAFLALLAASLADLCLRRCIHRSKPTQVVVGQDAHTEQVDSLLQRVCLEQHPCAVHGSSGDGLVVKLGRAWPPHRTWDEGRPVPEPTLITVRHLYKKLTNRRLNTSIM